MLQFRLIFLALFTALLGTAQANAGIIDAPKFKVDGFIIVWNGAPDTLQLSAGSAQAGRSATLDTSSAALPPNSIQTAHLIPVTPTQFSSLSAKATQSKHFYVASNTAFNIDAELVNAGAFSRAMLESLPFDLKLTDRSLAQNGYGSKAQWPHSGGTNAGFTKNINSLADISTRQTIYSGDRKTAATHGTITQQSVKFSMSYANFNSHASHPKADIVLTIYVL